MFFGLQVCIVKAHVLTRASMSGVPYQVFFRVGDMGVFSAFLFARTCPFLSAHIFSIACSCSVLLFWARDRHLSRLQ